MQNVFDNRLFSRPIACHSAIGTACSGAIFRHTTKQTLSIVSRHRRLQSTNIRPTTRAVRIELLLE